MLFIISIWITIVIVVLRRELANWIFSRFARRANADMFDATFIEPRTFYLRVFGRLPSIAHLGSIDDNQAFQLIRGGVFGEVTGIYQRNQYNWSQERLESTQTIFTIRDNILIRLGNDWTDIYFGPEGYERMNRIIDRLKTIPASVKEEEFEMNIISYNQYGLELKTLPIKPTNLDVNLYYNDDFKEVDAIIRNRLATENDKGIVLLHGLPGTGKTTYLRYLIGKLKKRVLFVSPGVAENLMNPEFMDILLDNPNSVLIIEDAENVIMDRRYSSQSSVSNLLNISDGLLSDCLNVQIICTFNSELDSVDSALLRKGRLIAKYEFGKLSVQKAKALSEHLGIEQEINKPMTVAEVSNPGNQNFQATRTNVIGFRRDLLTEN